jgi:prepilin-type N-terminal cleavage/methylation domain-containing protein
VTRTPTHAPSRHRKGFSLTELAIVLGIAGVLMGSIWVAASGIYSNRRQSRANVQLMTIVQNIRLSHVGRPTIAAAAAVDLTDLMIQSGMLPPDALESGATKGPWPGSSIHIYSSTTTQAGDAFEIQFRNIPSFACIVMLTANSGQGRDRGLRMASGRPTQNVYMNYAPTTFPVTQQDASTACGNALSDAVFVFSMKG